MKIDNDSIIKNVISSSKIEGIKFDVPFKMITETDIEKYRHDSFWLKEPETIAWIQSFQNGDTFYDIGANIGIYSLYCASLFPDCKIYAFEPDMKNYMRFSENIVMNGFHNIHALRMGIGAFESITTFYSQKDECGASGGQIGFPMDENGNIFNPASSIDVLIMSIDYFIKRKWASFPNHVKIDIDGLEDCVIAGMAETIEDRRLKSILIEINEKSHREETFEKLLKAGFSINNEFNSSENHSRYRRKREGIKAENWVFIR